MRVHRRRVAGALAVVLLAGAGAWTPTAVSAAQCGSTQQAGGRWSAVDMPPTPSLPNQGSTPIVSSSIVGQDPTVVLATDGVSVYRSTDGGCSWRTTYTLGPADYWSGSGLVSGYTITNIVSGHTGAPASRQTVYLALSPSPLSVFTFVPLFTFAPVELIAVSHDGGQSFAMVQPTPTAAHPIVPECLQAPTTIAASPTDPRAVYLQCSGGVAQTLAENTLSGGTSYLYRSADGGASWSLFGLPTSPQYQGQWFVVGPKAKELWVAGQSDGSNGSYWLAVWHSTDDGTHWTMSKPVGRPGVGIGSMGIAADLTSTGSGERVVVYAPVGAYSTTDSGKHWTRLRGLSASNSAVFVSVAFYLHHSLYAVAMSAQYGCKAGTAVLRYDNVRGDPVRTLFPRRWGYYYTWGVGGSFTAMGTAAFAFGEATFCNAPGSGATPPKFLTFRVR